MPEEHPLAHGEADKEPVPLGVDDPDDTGDRDTPANSDAVDKMLAEALLVAGEVGEAPALPALLCVAEPLPPPPLDALGVMEGTPLTECGRDSTALREGALLGVAPPVPDAAPLVVGVGLLLPPPEAQGVLLVLALPDALTEGEGDALAPAEGADDGDKVCVTLALALPRNVEGEGGALPLAARAPLGEEEALA